MQSRPTPCRAWEPQRALHRITLTLQKDHAAATLRVGWKVWGTEQQRCP